MDAVGLRDDLANASPNEVVRLIADWIDRARRAPELDLDLEPGLIGIPHLDAATGAAAAHTARLLGRPIPTWTLFAGRFSPTFWHPGPPSTYANALVHAPGEFALRGIFIEEASLQCV